MGARAAGIEEALPRIGPRLDRFGARVDAGFDAMGTRLRAAEQPISRLDGETDPPAGRIIGRLPSWWQTPAVTGTVVALLNGGPALMQSLRARGLAP